MYIKLLPRIVFADTPFQEKCFYMNGNFNYIFSLGVEILVDSEVNINLIGYTYHITIR